MANVGPIGCIPFERDTNPDAGDSCVAFPSQLAQLFNTQLRSLIAELNKNLKGSLFVYGDVYRILEDILQNYTAYGVSAVLFSTILHCNTLICTVFLNKNLFLRFTGFKNPHSACCYLAGRFGGLIPCFPKSLVCQDRSKYVFWDAYHPSEAANAIIASRLLDGETDDIFPMNVGRLAES